MRAPLSHVLSSQLLARLSRFLGPFKRLFKFEKWPRNVAGLVFDCDTEKGLEKARPVLLRGREGGEGARRGRNRAEASAAAA